MRRDVVEYIDEVNEAHKLTRKQLDEQIKAYKDTAKHCNFQHKQIEMLKKKQAGVVVMPGVYLPARLLECACNLYHCPDQFRTEECEALFFKVFV